MKIDRNQVHQFGSSTRKQIQGSNQTFECLVQTNNQSNPNRMSNGKQAKTQ
jgi:hypothetical protein